MPTERYPSTPDLLDRLHALEQEVRRLKVRHAKVYTESRTFIVGGDITVGMVIPPLIVSNMDGWYDMPRDGESKSVVGIKALCGIDGTTASTVTFQVGWLGRYEVATDYNALLSATTLTCHNGSRGLPHPYYIAHFAPNGFSPVVDGDAINVEITAVTGSPANLAVTIVFAAAAQLSPSEVGDARGNQPWY